MSLQYPLKFKADSKRSPGVAHWEGNVITCSPQDAPTMEVLLREFYFHHLELEKAEEAKSKLTGTLSPSDHKDQHVKLHEALDELVADYIDHTGNVPSKTTVWELIEWSAQQCVDPTEFT